MEMIRRESKIFPVEIEGEFGSTLLNDIYISELGFVMISIFDENKKITVNYICGEIKDFLPKKVKIKVEEAPRSFGP